MKKADARNIAINYLFSAACSFYSISCKQAIDDKGTLSEDGYKDAECDVIQKELDFLIKKVMKHGMKAKP